VIFNDGFVIYMKKLVRYSSSVVQSNCTGVLISP